MNREDITRLAQEAGFVGMDGDHGALRRFAALVASAEREACAKLCEDAAVEAGMPTSFQLAGKHIHTGGVVAVRRCCLDDSEIRDTVTKATGATP